MSRVASQANTLTNPGPRRTNPGPARYPHWTAHKCLSKDGLPVLKPSEPLARRLSSKLIAPAPKCTKEPARNIAKHNIIPTSESHIHSAITLSRYLQQTYITTHPQYNKDGPTDYPTSSHRQTPNTSEANHLYLQPYLTNNHTQQFTAAHIKSKHYRTRQTPDIRTYNIIKTATNPSTRQPSEQTTPTTVNTNRQPTNTCLFKPIHKYDTNRPPYTQHHNTVDLTHPHTAHLPAMSTSLDDQRPSTSRRSVKRFKCGRHRAQLGDQARSTIFQLLR